MQHIDAGLMVMMFVIILIMFTDVKSNNAPCNVHHAGLIAMRIVNADDVY
jgi:hypothetical protein